jgi:hypothetical protein
MPEAGWTANSPPEPVFGHTRGARRLNRFLLRDLRKMKRKWALKATSHTILKLFRATLATA